MTRAYQRYSLLSEPTPTANPTSHRDESEPWWGNAAMAASLPTIRHQGARDWLYFGRPSWRSA